MVVRIPSFVPASSSTDSYWIYMTNDFITMQNAAKAAGVTRILMDVTDNGGGYVISAYSVMWMFMKDTTKVCSPIRRRITSNWDNWMDSFGAGLDGMVDAYLVPQGDGLASKLDSIFVEISDIVTFMYDAMGNSVSIFGNVSKATALSRVATRKSQISAMSTLALKADAIRSYIKSAGWFPIEGSGNKDSLFPSSYSEPFNPSEIVKPQSGGQYFSPAMSNYQNTELKDWGNDARYSLPGEFSFCSYTVNTAMPIVAAGWDKSYWTQVGLVTDGTCGSACALFSQIQLQGDAVAFSYGGIKDEPVDVASFAGGNVEEYDSWWGSVALALKTAKLATGGLAPYFNTTRVDSWKYVPVPFPSKASGRFNNGMMMSIPMGVDSMPRQFYQVPARKAFNIWTSSDAGRMDVYNSIIGISDWRLVDSQFSAYGQCPKDTVTITTSALAR